jgi:peptidoglycan/LPS O-acetylase OafA/YrhL
VSPTVSRPARLAGLDGLRAVAAIMVLSYHAALFSRFAFAGPLAAVLWELKGGVAIFFVISGAVLYLPHARAIREGKPLPDCRRYAARRAVRILPAYWLVLTAFAIGPFAAGIFGPNLWSYYGLSQIYRRSTLFSGLGVAWSLCVEVTFYALLPLFGHGAARLARRAGSRSVLRTQLLAMALAAAVSIVLRGVLAGSPTAPIGSQGATLVVALPGFLDWFAIGMALAVFAAEWEAGRAGERALVALAARPGWCAGLALGAFALGATAQHGDMFLPWYGLFTHVMLGVGSGLIVLAVIGPDRGRGRAPWLRLLRGAWLGWLGAISYGVYLWHLVALELISPHPESRTLFDALLLWLFALAAALLLGAASWYLVERPLQRGLRGYERRLDRARRHGRTPDLDEGVQLVTDRLNPTGVAADHLA